VDIPVIKLCPALCDPPFPRVVEAVRRDERDPFGRCPESVQDRSITAERRKSEVITAKNFLHQGCILQEAGVLADRDDLVHIRVSIQHIRCPAVYERIDAGIRISEPEGTEERGRQENVPDMACGNQEDVLCREFHREIKV
jgi:hypothetical protein